MFTRVLPLIILSLVVSNATVLRNSINTGRLQGILKDSLKSKDISTLFHAIKGLNLLNVKLPDLCEVITNSKFDLQNPEQVYYLTTAASIAGCVNFLKPEVLAAANQSQNKKDPTIAELFYGTYSLKALGKGEVFDKENGLKNLIQLLKKDDTPLNYGYLFTLCEHMGCQPWTVSHSESVLLAADEIDGKALSFEGGLPATSLILSSIIRSHKLLKKPSPLTEEQRYKFAEYLSTRQSVSSARGAALLLEAATLLADDQPSPVSIAIKGRKYVTSEADSIEISVTDLIGRPLKTLKPDEVVAQSGTRLADDVVVLSKQPLTPKQNEPGTFILNLSKIKAQYGLYKIALSAGTKTTNVNVAVLGEIQVTSIEVGIGDVDGTTSPKVTTVAYPNTLKEKLQADHMQKVTLKFTVVDKSKKAVSVQQAFVRVAAAGEPDRETIFVAEPDNTKAYKVELNVAGLAKHLQHASGLYSLTLYLGDSAVSSPVAWTLGEIHFNLGKDANAVGSVVKSPGRAVRSALPELQHEFRAAEARPARALSDVFAGACAVPLLLLLALWAKLRINLSNLPFSLSALVFHLALGASFGLYGLLWLQLSMFETVRLLLPLGALTFLSGHRLLRRLVQDKTAR